MRIKRVIPFVSVFLLSLLLTSCIDQTRYSRLMDVSEPDVSNLTVMVYMAADNDLESYALENLKAMEKAQSSGIKTLVLLDRSEGYDETDGNWTDTRLFEVVHDETSSSAVKSKRLDCPLLNIYADKDTELDMANPNVLKKFIEFSKGAYPAKKYALIIWGHGTGWRYASDTRAVAIDDRSESYMSVYELGKALKNQGLDVIGFDTCFGGVFENIYELKDCAEYTVACPGVTPGSGWDYKKLLESISSGDFETQSIAETMAQSAWGNTTVFVNEKLSELFISFEAFSKALSETVTDSQSQKKVLEELLGIKGYSYTQYPCDLYLDVFSMADFYKASSDPALSDGASVLKEKLDEAVLSVSGKTSGLGVHLIPKEKSGVMASVHSEDYVKDSERIDQCAFIKESLWWVPTKNGNYGSLLDKLFYTSF